MYTNPMYFNNPYYFSNPGMANVAKKGLFSSLFGASKVNWSSLLNNTQKTLNVINQAIPVYYQIKPICSNAKTMLRMISALKDDDKKNNQTSTNEAIKKQEKNTETGPVFFT